MPNSRMNARRAILSSEFFWAATAAEIQQIRKYLDGFDVRVVVYLRNYWDLMISQFKERVKGGTWTLSFQETLKETMWMLDYEGIVDRWSTVFNVDVRVYDKVKRNLLEDFGEATSCSLRTCIAPRNVSPSDAVIRLMLLRNRLGRHIGLNESAALHRVGRKMLTGKRLGLWIAAFADAVDSRTIGTDADRVQLRSATHNMRQRFLNRYISDDDRCYFDF